MMNIIFVIAYLLLAPFIGGLLDGVDRIISARNAEEKRPGTASAFL